MQAAMLHGASKHRRPWRLLAYSEPMSGHMLYSVELTSSGHGPLLPPARFPFQTLLLRMSVECVWYSFARSFFIGVVYLMHLSWRDALCFAVP